MKEYVFDSFRVLKKEPVYTEQAALFSRESAEKALRFHKSLPTYRETPLASLSAAAERYGVGAILVKDESRRLGLKAFKGLGGSYSMFRILCERLGLDESTADYGTFLREDVRRACAGTEFVTATDGNHGKGVSWAAKLFSCRAHVFMPKGSAEARRRAIEEAGAAVAAVTEFNYDQTVRYAASLAEQNGWILIQDTAWEGYETVPAWIMEGYLTLAAETEKQMDGARPTHLFLQAGVGAMAGGMEAYFMNQSGGAGPLVTIVEPEEAACVYQSVLADDGEAHSIEGNPDTIMAGLNCGTPCQTAWPILRDCSAFCCACGDIVTEQGMRAYAKPLGRDPRIVSGESGAVTYGLLLAILQSEALRRLFRIDRDSVLLLINTEGDTDPEGYRRIVGTTA